MGEIVDLKTFMDIFRLLLIAVQSGRKLSEEELKIFKRNCDEGVNHGE